MKPTQFTTQQVSLEKARESIGSWGHLHPERFSMTTEVARGAILDAGCSTGNYVRTLNKLGHRAFGCDLLEARRWRQEQNRPFTCANVCFLPYPDNSFDTIIFFEVLEHILESEQALNEIHRVSQQNLVLSVPNCERPDIFQAAGVTYHHWIDRTHVQTFTEDSLVTLLNKSRFEVKKIKYINPINPELLLLDTWRVPIKVARRLSWIVSKVPLRKPYHMTLLVHAVKK